MPNTDRLEQSGRTVDRMAFNPLQATPKETPNPLSVYEAASPRWDVLVGYKSVHVAEHGQQWLREFDTLRTLGHPHLVQIQRAYKCTGDIYMLAEPFCYGSFDQLLGQSVDDLGLGEMTIKDFLIETVGCLSSAQRYLHCSRIVYENIQGANIPGAQAPLA